MAPAKTGLNEAQQRVAETFGRPIAAMAGAGSGKTFTMVRRILNAFDPGLVGDPDLVVEDIDQVLAITFTEKAAEELKSRIRAGLKSIRRPDQARKVDAAWIGTIHGMCSRILRENALELGIDPSFAVLEEDARSALLDEVTERVLLSDDPETVEDVRRLLREYRRQNLKTTISRLVDKASQSLGGFDSLEACPFDEVVAREGEGLPDGCLADAEEVVEARLPDSLRKTARDNAVAAFRDNVGIFARFAPLWKPLVRVARAVEESLWERKRALGVLDQNDLLTQAVHALSNPAVGRRYADRFRLVINDEFQDTDCLQFEIIRRLSGEGMRRLCVVGDVKQSIYRFRGADLSLSEGFVTGLRKDDAEHHRTSVFDMEWNYRSAGEVLDFVNLVFEPRPGTPTEPRLPFPYDPIRHGRREDASSLEFTDEAHGGPRVEVVEVQHTAGGKRAATDLSARHVARRFKEIHERTGRPYGDMVVLLNAMTSAPLFADALDAEGIPNAITGGSVFARRPVPNVLLGLVRLLANPLDGEAVAVTLSSDLFGFEPEDFRELVDRAGIEPQSNAKLPIDRALASLLDHRDSEDPIAAGPGEGRVAVAVDVLGRAVALIGHVPPSRILEGVLADSGWLVRQSGSGFASFARLDDGEDVGGAHGMAAVADALKFIRMARDLEADGCLGFRDLSVRLARRLEELKEPPGFLATEGNDFVRIMTIHASKGLEFPVVAVSGLAKGQSHLNEGKCALVSASRRSVDSTTGETRYDLATYAAPLPDRSEFAMEKAVIDRLHFASSPGRNALAAIHDYGCELQARADGVGRTGTTGELVDLIGREAFDELMDRARNHDDPSLWYAAMRLYEDDAEKAELMRKAYVAYTRAREALIVCLSVPVRKDECQAYVNEAKGVGAKGEIDDLEVRYAYCPDLHPIDEGNEVTARIQRRRDAIAEWGAYRFVPFARVNVWNDFDVWPPELGGEPDDPEAGRPLVTELPETDAEANVLEPPPPVDIPVSFVERAVTNRRFSPHWADGILSASSIKERDHGTVYEGPVDGSAVADDGDEAEPPAHEKGSAFHEICQLAVLERVDGESLVPPSEERIRAILRRHALSERQRADVREALEAWFASPIAREVVKHRHVEAELPFFVPLDGAIPANGDRGVRFDGYIDLFAYDELGRGTPSIVDYKTGTTYRTPEERQRAYRTQAMVYAYAVMLQGFDRPKVTFVLVEQREGDDLATCEFPAAGETWTLEGLREELLEKVRTLAPQEPILG